MKGNLKLIELSPVTQVNKFRNNLQPVPKDPVYDGTNPGMVSIKEIIGRDNSEVTNRNYKPVKVKLNAWHNPFIGLMYATERLIYRRFDA